MKTVRQREMSVIAFNHMRRKTQGVRVWHLDTKEVTKTKIKKSGIKAMGNNLAQGRGEQVILIRVQLAVPRKVAHRAIN
jgi:hypothetical protein